MIRIGKKFFKPHLCPACGKLIVLVRHPRAVHCPRCRNRKHHRTVANRSQQKKYNNSNYRKARNRAMTNRGYCALCGCTEHLTCHHTVDVQSGEWQGRHLTVLCDQCHRMWETKVNKIRKLSR